MNKNTDKTILITGANGFLGAYLLHYLLKEGFSGLRCVRERGSRMNLVADVEEQVEWMEGDLTDIVFLEDALEGIQQVYHCAGLVSFDSRHKTKMMQINFEATKNLVDLALLTGVEKLIHVSSGDALGGIDKKEVSEINEWEWNNKVGNYAISKFLGEREVWRAHAEGLDMAIVNPSILLGSGFWEIGSLKLFQNAWEEQPFYPLGSTGFVDVRDVAKALIKLMNSKMSGERFILSAENLTYREVANMMATQLGKKGPGVALTPWLREILWRMEWLRSRFLGRDSLVSKESLRHASRNCIYQNQKSRQILSLEYTPVKETIAASCELFLENFEKKAVNILPL